MSKCDNIFIYLFSVERWVGFVLVDKYTLIFCFQDAIRSIMNEELSK